MGRKPGLLTVYSWSMRLPSRGRPFRSHQQAACPDSTHNHAILSCDSFKASLADPHFLDTTTTQTGVAGMFKDRIPIPQHAMQISHPTMVCIACRCCCVTCTQAPLLAFAPTAVRHAMMRSVHVPCVAMTQPTHLPCWVAVARARQAALQACGLPLLSSPTPCHPWATSAAC